MATCAKQPSVYNDQKKAGSTGDHYKQASETIRVEVKLPGVWVSSVLDY